MAKSNTKLSKSAYLRDFLSKMGNPVVKKSGKAAKIPKFSLKGGLKKAKLIK